MHLCRKYQTMNTVLQILNLAVRWALYGMAGESCKRLPETDSADFWPP